MIFFGKIMSVFVLFIIFLASNLFAENLPENASPNYYGNGWSCNGGYYKSGNKCLAVNVPDNGELDYTGHSWVCSQGYYKSGNKCLAVNVPDNAELDYTGHSWVCSQGYYKSGNKCLDHPIATKSKTPSSKSSAKNRESTPLSETPNQTYYTNPYIYYNNSINTNSVHVNGYYRKDGTYVNGHYRSSPNSSFGDNWSTKGNYNPKTGKKGYKTKKK
jgi:hypothetical protein